MFCAMIRQFLIFLFLVCSFEALGQVQPFDKLELLYSQGYYKMVYRRANRLLDKPDYDYSNIPDFYKSLSGFQLAQYNRWSSKHPRVLDESVELFQAIMRSPEGKRVVDAHNVEVSHLKNELVSWARDLQRRGKKAEFERIRTLFSDLFGDLSEFDPKREVDETESEEEARLNTYGKERDELVKFAQIQLGVPYVWAGSDSNGFDCSGFTCYVMKKGGKELPRRAIDQYEKSRKVKPRNAQKGDLVFFDGGSGISHVGVLISERGTPLVMIHASSSNGVVITEIERSEYWLKRLKGFGTFMY